MASSNIHALQAALLLPPERLSEVHRRAISRTPISVLIEGLLSKNEAGQLALCPRRLSNNENVVSDCQRIAAAIASATSHVLNCSFFISKENCFFTHLADFFESVMGLREFCDILSLVILQFGGHIGNESLCVEISLISRRHHRFFYFAFDKQ